MFRKIVVSSLCILVGCGVPHTEPIEPGPCGSASCSIPNVHADVQTVFGLERGEMVKSRTQPDDTPISCSDDMVEIEGDYCPSVKQTCLYMVDNKGNKTNEPIDPNGRCGEWANNVKCNSKLVYKHYCIDKFELPNEEGTIPTDWMTWYDVKNACESEGKRMCTRSEWTFAAEGPNMHPYPYGDGFHRDRTICNFDRHIAEQPATIKRADGRLTTPTGDDVMNVTSVDSDVGQALHNMLVPSGSMKQCISDWGVHDMPGNIDEWVVNESGQPYISGLMGGHVFGVRNASRPMTDAHGPTFSWYETGGRCCADPK